MNIKLFKKIHNILLGIEPGKFKDETKETLKDIEQELERLEFEWSKSEKKYNDLKKVFEEKDRG
jgi:predicted nuclease with TOPRIM domain